jgi:hypothetical protein
VYRTLDLVRGWLVRLSAVGIPRSDTASNVDPKGVAQRTEPNYDINELLKVIRLEGEFVLSLGAKWRRARQ